MHTITEELLIDLKNSDNIENFIKKHESKFISKTSSEYLNEIAAIRNMSISDIAKKSGCGEYVYKIFRGERNPSRDTLISIAFGMKLSLEETQLLLRISKFAILDSRDKRDSIIIYCITHELEIFQADDLLFENNFVTIIR